MRLRPFSRVFTRMGSSDSIMQNKSTFYIEMEECLNIIHNCGQTSLVLLDELGRGTGHIDGISIAFAIVKHLISYNKCTFLASTHSH